LEGAGELADGAGEGEVEEQLQPAGAPFVVAVAVGGAQRRMAQMRRTAGGVPGNAAGAAGRVDVTGAGNAAPPRQIVAARGSASAPAWPGSRG